MKDGYYHFHSSEDKSSERSNNLAMVTVKLQKYLGSVFIHNQIESLSSF